MNGCQGRASSPLTSPRVLRSQLHMCKTRRGVDAASPRPKPTSSPSASAASDAVRPSYSFTPSASSASTGGDRHARRLLYESDFDSAAASSAANLRLSLSQDNHPFHLYSFTEILSATDRFLAPPLSPSADSWRCRLRGGDAVVFRRPFLGDTAVLPSRIAALCRSHHGSVVELLGASLADDHIYLVYSYVAGASLFRCLRNPQNPSFTPLASWFARVQVAADVAQGLEYIHHHSETATPGNQRRSSGTVHNWVKSSGIIITEPGLRAKLCHFGAAELAGEVPANYDDIDGKVLDESAAANAELARSRSRGKKIEWTRGYMAPEVLAGGVVSRRSDVFAFGVVLLELLSGEEPVRYRFCQEKDAIEKVSVIETARAAMGPEGEEEAKEEEGRRGRIRRWVDRRLGDSFPVEGAEEGMRVALRCVAEEAAERPQMVWVAGKLSKLLIQAKAWEDRVKTTPTRYLTSVGPR
ncbi:hypothetical protein B296_00000331 [Ensete ventricosum]|uniref:Protein kinase domain-containing protein n=1 Tax=Ensete ventricosum TaxID=4639 RepID=A0A427B7P2_ENSVE|nr:hypothetical protein B296_00000331 [Ensete ventricosum]